MAKRKIKRTFRKTLKRVDKTKKFHTDKFWDEDSGVNAEDAFVSQPSHAELREVISDLPGYRDWARERRGNGGLTFGDY